MLSPSLLSPLEFWPYSSLVSVLKCSDCILNRTAGGWGYSATQHIQLLYTSLYILLLIEFSHSSPKHTTQVYTSTSVAHHIPLHGCTSPSIIGSFTGQQGRSRSTSISMDMDMSSAYPHHWLSFSLSNNYHHGLLEAFSNSSATPLGTTTTNALMN